MSEKSSIPADAICFGLDRVTDERSLVLFLRLFCRDQLLDTLVPRLEDFEIEQVVDQLSTLMRTHLQEKEYHELFLDDHDHHH
ncbi:MAG TPA: hypothetical protein ENI88_04000 [Desulfobulbus sp.]|nr:hypothetical protein [Desulfobulbus sp.]